MGATSLTEMEIKTTPYPVLFALQFPRVAPATMLALSPDERFLAVVQGGESTIHVFWVPGVALRSEKTPLACFEASGGSVISMSWSGGAREGSAPELLVCTLSSVAVFAHTGTRLATCSTQATAAEWLRECDGRNESAHACIVLGLPDGTASCATVDYAASAVTPAAPGASVFTATKPDAIAGAQRELHFLSAPRPGLLLVGWRPITSPPPEGDVAPAVILAVYEQQRADASWSCVVLDSVCLVDENDPTVDLSRQQFVATVPVPGWDVVAVASNMSSDVAMIGRGIQSGSKKAGKKDSTAWFHWQALFVGLRAWRRLLLLGLPHYRSLNPPIITRRFSCLPHSAGPLCSANARVGGRFRPDARAGRVRRPHEHAADPCFPRGGQWRVPAPSPGPDPLHSVQQRSCCALPPGFGFGGAACLASCSSAHDFGRRGACAARCCGQHRRAPRCQPCSSCYCCSSPAYNQLSALWSRGRRCRRCGRRRCSASPILLARSRGRGRRGFPRVFSLSSCRSPILWRPPAGPSV